MTIMPLTSMTIALPSVAASLKVGADVNDFVSFDQDVAAIEVADLLVERDDRPSAQEHEFIAATLQQRVEVGLPFGIGDIVIPAIFLVGHPRSSRFILLLAAGRSHIADESNIQAPTLCRARRLHVAAGVNRPRSAGHSTFKMAASRGEPARSPTRIVSRMVAGPSRGTRERETPI